MNSAFKKCSSRISIITAVFNTRRFLRQTVESISNQTFPIHEHILINDASTDGSGDLANQLAQEFPSVKVIHNPSNRGFPTSLNIGIQSSSSPYVGILDSDDIALPTWIQTVLPVIESDPSIASVGGGCIFMSESGSITNRRGYCSPAGDVTGAARMGTYPFLHPGTVHRKEALLRIGLYNQKIKSAEDLDLFLSVSHGARLVNVGEPLIYYRRRRGSESRKTAEYNKAISNFLSGKRKLLAEGYSVEEANGKLCLEIDGFQNIDRIRKVPAWEYDSEMGDHFEFGGRYFFSIGFRLKVLLAFKQKISSARAIARCAIKTIVPRYKRSLAL